MKSVEVYYEDETTKEIVCFRHAVLAASIEGHMIKTDTEEQDSGDSGCWYPTCKVCEREGE